MSIDYLTIEEVQDIYDDVLDQPQDIQAGTYRSIYCPNGMYVQTHYIRWNPYTNSAGSKSYTTDTYKGGYYYADGKGCSVGGYGWHWWNSWSTQGDSDYCYGTHSMTSVQHVCR